MRTVTVHYFALLREQAGCAEERVSTTATTPAGLLVELSSRHGFTLPRDALKVAVNDDFVDWDRALEDGDRVALLPPVAGG